MKASRRLWLAIVGGLAWATLLAKGEAWPAGVAPEEVGRRVAANFVAREHMVMPPDQVVHYAEVCAWQGALAFAALAREGALQRQLLARYGQLMQPENATIIPQREHVDWAVFGVLPLEVFLQTGDERAKVEGLGRADRQWVNPRVDGLSRQTRFWIDDMYMIGALQTQAYRATKDPVYLERAAKSMVVYLARLQQPNGLFFHGDTGRFFWGRGNGWMAAGMTELLRELPRESEHYAAIMGGYQKMMAALLAHQDAAGRWHQLVDDPEAWTEGSCTGMFTYALITGTKRGWLDAETYGPAARKGWLGLVGLLDADANVRDVCLGMGQQATAQGYLEARRGPGDLHGQAPVLWCAAAWLR